MLTKLFTKASTKSPAHLQRGVDAERSALAYLKSNGLRLLQQNYRCAHGELDMIMLDQQELVFVEVRYRRSDAFGGALASVNAAKQRKLRVAAEVFLQEHPELEFEGCRFDVMAMSGNAPGYEIDWVSDAFT